MVTPQGMTEAVVRLHSQLYGQQQTHICRSQCRKGEIGDFWMVMEMTH
jgi:hypothetical protein